ncbi:MAG: HIT family protein [Eubacteriales bacterium]|nr:HIT family protein [Eubacteriales bacterium]
MDCIFCKILNGDIPSRKVFENERFIAILDAFPANEGHTLVIPKKHFENIFEIDEETISEAYKIAKNIAEKIKANMGIENINILQNNGATAGQSVNHFHIHVIPRIENDTVTIKSEVVKISNERLDEIKEILSK